jgi:hypothetical protein
MSGIPVDAASDRRWPFHPRPFDCEDPETWVRRIYKVFNVAVRPVNVTMPI